MLNLLRNISSSIIAIIIWSIFLITFLVLVSLFLFVTLFISPKRLSPLIRILARLLLLSAGQLIKIEGEIPNSENGPHLYLFNHQSLFDQFALAGAVKEYISAVGADYQFWWPVWGTLIKRLGAIPIVRKNLDKAIYSLALAEEEIKKGTSFIISPEGTRTLTGKMGDFKKGPFHLSLNTGVTIIPVGLMGAFNAKKLTDWRVYPGKIKVKFGNPVHKNYYQKMSVEQLRDDIRKRIALLCNDDSIVAMDN